MPGLFIIDADWTPRVNMLVIGCEMHGREVFTFRHRADRWRVVCPVCSERADLADLRDSYQRQHAIKARQEPQDAP